MRTVAFGCLTIYADYENLLNETGKPPCWISLCCPQILLNEDFSDLSDIGITPGSSFKWIDCPNQSLLGCIDSQKALHMTSQVLSRIVFYSEQTLCLDVPEIKIVNKMIMCLMALGYSVICGGFCMSLTQLLSLNWGILP